MREVYCLVSSPDNLLGFSKERERVTNLLPGSLKKDGDIEYAISLQIKCS